MNFAWPVSFEAWFTTWTRFPAVHLHITTFGGGSSVSLNNLTPGVWGQVDLGTGISRIEFMPHYDSSTFEHHVFGTFAIDDINVQFIPEPAAIIILGVGVIAMTRRPRG